MQKLIRTFETIPQAIKEQCCTNPEFRVPFDFPGHALSLKPSSIIKALDQGKSVEQIVEEKSKEAAKWLETPFSRAALERIPQLLKEIESGIKANRFKNILNNPILNDCKTIRSLLERIDVLVAKTIGEDTNMRTKLTDYVIQKLITDRIINPNTTLFFELGDTNWLKTEGFGFIPHVEGSGFVPAVSDADLLDSKVLHLEEDVFDYWSIPLSWTLQDAYNLKLAA